MKTYKVVKQHSMLPCIGFRLGLVTTNKTQMIVYIDNGIYDYTGNLNLSHQLIIALAEAGYLEEVVEKPKHKRWRAEKGAEYFVFDENCLICMVRDYGNWFDDRRWSLGNYYRTREEAQIVLDKRLALQRIKDYCLDNFGEFVPDWENPNESKFFIQYLYSSKKLGVNVDWADKSLGGIYLSSNKRARQLIRDMKDDLLIVFGIQK